MDFIREYYTNYDEDGRLLRRHGQVEFLTTMRYIEKYLTPGARIIEIGAGTGRYSLALASMGYSVDAVELTEHNIGIFKSNITPEQTVTVTQGDARDLSAFTDGAYDITLLLGPLYHLYTEDDKRRAISEALRVTKRGGVVFAAYCNSDAGIMDYGFRQGHALDLVEKKMLDPETFAAHSDPKEIFELCRKEDVDALMAPFGTERLHYIASDGMTNHFRPEINAMDDDTFALYLKYHFAVCERPDMVGATHHMLDVFKKKG